MKEQAEDFTRRKGRERRTKPSGAHAGSGLAGPDRALYGQYRWVSHLVFGSLVGLQGQAVPSAYKGTEPVYSIKYT